MSEIEHPIRNAIAKGSAVLLLFLLPFLPLLLALAEHLTAGTAHVEQFFIRIGIHDELDVLYQPLLRFFR